MDIAGCVKGVIHAAKSVFLGLGQFDNAIHDRLISQFRRVHKVGHAELARHFGFVGIQIHTDDLVSPRHTQALDHVQTNATQTKDRRRRADLDPRRIDHRTNARGDAAADVADLIKWRVVTHLRQGDFRQHRMVGKGRAAHVVIDRRAIQHREPRRAIRHQTLTLGATDRGAEVGFARQTGMTLTTFRRVERDHVIARLKRGDAFAHLNHNTRAFMAQDRRKQTLRVSARTGEFIRVTNTGRFDLDQNLALFRAF